MVVMRHSQKILGSIGTLLLLVDFAGADKNWESQKALAARSRTDLKVYLASLEPASSDPASLEPDEQMDTPPCFTCDLGGVNVPHSVTWVTQSNPKFIDELFAVKNPALVWDYWSELEAAAAWEHGGPALHRSCGLDGYLPSAVWRILEQKKRAGRDGPSGALLAFRGDSHSRVTFQAAARSLSREARAVLSVNFDIATAHADHLFCCAGYAKNTDSQRNPFSFYNCSVESGQRFDPKTIKFDNKLGLHGTILSEVHYVA